MNWSIFKKTLNDNIKLNISLKTIDEINEALDSLTSSIQSAALCASITKTNQSIHNNIPKHIQILLLKKRKARAKWQNSRYPNDKIKLNQLSNKLKKVIRKHKNDSYNSYVEALTTTNCSL